MHIVSIVRDSEIAATRCYVIDAGNLLAYLEGIVPLASMHIQDFQACVLQWAVVIT